MSDRGRGRPTATNRRVSLLVAALLVALVALVCSVGIADAPHPPGLFLKYPVAANWSPAVLAARELDYSPLYLALNRAFVDHGDHAVLWLQCALHAVLSMAVMAAVARLASLSWAVAAGLVCASYRPFLVYCGVHEPEIVLLVILALAIGLAVEARHRLAASGAWDGALFTALATAAMALASTVRPQYLLLVPVWAQWCRAAARGDRTRVIVVAVVGALVVLAPSFVGRLRDAGNPVVMNPGPVFYEGNGPAATGSTRHAPRVIHALERAHPESPDYGHVAYRRLAAAALGRPATVAETNRYWLALAVDGMIAQPGRAARRLLDKALFAVMPRELHDLQVAEDLDRRLRARLPWGFLVLLVAATWVVMARSRWLELLGPIALAGVAIATQVVFYGSARQRLPLALALLIAGGVAASELARDRLLLRRRLAVAVALAVAALVAFVSGPSAVGDEVTWDAVRGPSPSSIGESLARLQDGSALTPWTTQQQSLFAEALGRLNERDLDAAQAGLDALSGLDLTADDRVVGVPEYWSAIVKVRRGDFDGARLDARQAVARRPGEPLIAAIAALLAEPTTKLHDDFQPPGIDPVSAKWALQEAARLLGDGATARSAFSAIDEESFRELFAP